MKKTTLYLGLCIVGAVVPWLFLLQFLLSGEAGVMLFLSSIFVNAVAGAVAADLLIAALAFCLFLYLEGKRLGMQRLWLYPLATFSVGLSFGLPLFLYCREKAGVSELGE